MRETAENLQHLTAPGSDFIGAVGRFHALADNLVELSKPGSTLSNSLESLNGSLKNVDKITTDLLQSNKINLTLDNIQEAAKHMEKATSNLDAIILRLGPNLTAVTANAAEFTDTLKREPWRLIWHSTKDYPGDQPLGSPLAGREAEAEGVVGGGIRPCRRTDSCRISGEGRADGCWTGRREGRRSLAQSYEG